VTRPDVALTTAQVAATADTIEAAQLPSGQIEWFPGGQTDPWDHVEAAMGLDVAGRPEAAAAAYDWLRAVQNPDGSWFRGYQAAEPSDLVRESNFTGYLAVGLLHHILEAGDDAILDRMWPTLERAVGFVLDLQRPGGEISWARGLDGEPAREALLTGCSSLFHSLRCAVELARLRGEPQPDWELAAATLGHALAAHPERFSPKDRYSMDWYYPILGGVLRGDAAKARIEADWDRFVVPGLGVRCVGDRPWVTGAETCELVLALCAVQQYDRAAELFTSVQHLRDPDGSYWTGYVYPDDARWPEERTTWTAGAALLASAALAGEAATTAVFGGAALPVAIVDTCDLDVSAA
jgi:hypothetical protein